MNISHNTFPTLLLASGSPRRRDLLLRIGIHAEVHPVDVEETILEEEDGQQAAVRLATQKAREAHRRFPGRTILAADTVVVHGGKILGKPRDRDDAVAMLRLLSGEWHEVVSGLALIDATGNLHVALSTTEVKFALLDEEEILTYTNTHEPYDKAGAYGIQGAAGWFIEKIRGSASNVIGLPYEQLRLLFRSAGLPLPSLSPHP